MIAEADVENAVDVLKIDTDPKDDLLSIDSVPSPTPGVADTN